MGSDSYLCRVRTYNTKVLGKHAEMTVVDSDEFKWTSVGSSYWELKGGFRPFDYGLKVNKKSVKPQPLRSEPKERGGLIYAVEVIEYGNKK